MDTATPARSTWASPRRPFPHAACSAAPSGLAAVYRRRQPTATSLYPIVQHHLETFLARAAEEDPFGDSLPGLMARALNLQAWAARYLGQRSSARKAASARVNGKKGGRPRKNPSALD